MLASLLLPAMPARAQPQGGRAQGDGFSVPVPPGFTRLVDGPQAQQIGRAGGVVLRQDRRPTARDAITAHIIVVPAVSDPFDVKTDAGCRRIAGSVAAQGGMLLQGSKLVDSATGRTCQVALGTRASKHYRNVTTVLQDEHRHRVLVICTRDARDPGSDRACATVLRGWREGARRERPRRRDPHGH